MTLEDKSCQGAGGSVPTPFKRHHRRPPLSRNQKAVNRAHAKVHGIGERAVTTLKTWKVLVKLHCCPPARHRPTRRDLRTPAGRGAALRGMKSAQWAKFMECMRGLRISARFCHAERLRR